ncbi:MAG: hypothetical protein A4E73_03190 [Syntrophaceae bacterium PtaU1.Bin231]|jgi:hypothetical protein|nr:MAG: hypothetical protein A4E73_03190 [Syntrophaceae bacterium PtaU1.Bin231]
MRIPAVWTSTIMAALIVAAASTDAAAMRCREGKGMVGEGDTKGKVLIECGEPDNRIIVSYTYNPSGQAMPSVEKWYYNCGDNRFIYELEFSSDTLNVIRSMGRGSGRHRCE